MCLKQIANSQIAFENSLRRDLIGEDSYVSMIGMDSCVFTEPQMKEVDRRLTLSTVRVFLSERERERA